MNELKIPYVPSLNIDSAFNDIAQQLSGLPLQALDNLLWSDDGYKPKVSFKIAHSGKCIFLKYLVNEQSIRAVYNQPNDPVYKDTCVEFFISLNGDENYYNLEFNCIGTCLVGYGIDKYHRMALPAEKISKIRAQTQLEHSNDGFAHNWELTLAIPTGAFMYHQSIDLRGAKCHVNFYKCGDELPQPHFIAWNNIDWPQPDFHLPRFFGKAVFLR